LRIARVSTVIDLSRALGWLPPEQYITSPMAKPKALSIWHGTGYLEALQAAEAEGHVSDEIRTDYGLGTPSNPVFPEMFRRPATSAGGSLLAGEMLRKPGIIFHPAGGTHHGMPNRANGFCYLNDPVLAILALQRVGLSRVAYIDLDAHYPDGVVYGFADDPSVLVASTHQDGLWPRQGALGDRGRGNMVNCPVPAGYNDTEARAILHDVLLPKIQEHRPDAIVVQCGADGLLEDPQARMALSNLSYLEAISEISALTDRLLVLGGGGYNPWSVGRAWTSIWGHLTGQDVPERLPQAATDILKSITWTGNSRAKNPAPHLFTSLHDTPREGPVSDAVRAVIAYHKR